MALAIGALEYKVLGKGTNEKYRKDLSKEGVGEGETSWRRPVIYVSQEWKVLKEPTSRRRQEGRDFIKRQE